MSMSFPSLSTLRRSFAVAAVAGSAVAGAQTPALTTLQPMVLPGTTSSSTVAGLAPDALFSSSTSSDVSDAATSAVQMNLASLEKGINLPGVNPQYGRRRYGAPRYRGANTNADGSEKYTFFAGAGLTLPVGTKSNYLTTSYGFQVGGGRNFNKRVGLDLQFDWDKFGVTGDTLNNQSYLYFGDPTNSTYGLDGTSHIWSLTLDPIYYLKSGEGLGAYVTGGGGFYHKTANFFVPTIATGIDPYYGYEYQYEANETVDKYTSNSAGVNVGFGVTYKFSRFANERLYGEVRYVHTFNSERPGITAGDSVATISSYTGNNYFPSNSNPTSYLPIKFGIRF